MIKILWTEEVLLLWLKQRFSLFLRQAFFVHILQDPVGSGWGLGGTDYRQCSTRSLKPSKFLNEASAANGSSELLHFVRFF